MVNGDIYAIRNGYTSLPDYPFEVVPVNATQVESSSLKGSQPWGRMAGSDLYLTLPTAPNMGTSLTIMSLNGTPVLHRVCTASESVIDLKHLPTGVYIARVMHEGERFSFKVVKR